MRRRRGRRDRREYLNGVRLTRMRPYDNRTARRGRVNERGKMIIMLVITVFLVVISGKAVYELIQSRKTPDAIKVAEDIPDGEDGPGKTGEEAGKTGGDGEGAGTAGEEAPLDKDVEPIAEDQGEKIPLVVIDPGHGGYDNGSNIDGIYEQEINMDISRLLADKLEEMGIETLLLREDNDTHLSLQERVEMAEAAGADIYVSIHQNYYDATDDPVSGMETWYCNKLEDSKYLAQLVQDGAVGKTMAVDRGLRETDELYVICKTSMPSCLIETGFLSDKAEREALLSREYQEKLAEGIAEGINTYFSSKQEE